MYNVSFEEEFADRARELSEQTQAEILLAVMQLADDPWPSGYREIEHKEDGETFVTFEIDVPETTQVIGYTVIDNLISLTELRTA